ncbi:amidohydrolase family protein [Halonatronum saccharophilum]|uniref:amidohydrolase family protein n=1 Tax=Halonatronum saccharophilum TaxID=150060 RepID=UPI00048849FA|nr:amidohydrolase family protein [Halonatronum saccharophilum]
MFDNFFNKVNLSEDRINIPSGDIDKLEEFCKEYDQKIDRAGGIDLQVLGIGTNGHVGFNEPDHILKTGTHVVELAQAIKLISLNPAKRLNFEDKKGSIKKGKDRDLIVLDSNFNVKRTFIEGIEVYTSSI